MAASYKNLQDIAEGSVFTIQEKSKVSEYIVLKHGWATVEGVPQTLVVRRYLAERSRWSGIIGGRDSYEGGDLDKACQNFIGNFMDASTTGFNIISRIPTLQITIKDDGGSVGRTISRRCWSLSRSEVGFISSNNVYAEGSSLAYFNSDNARKAYWADNPNNSQVWWLRSGSKIVVMGITVRNGYQVGTNGKQDDALQTESYWYRPTLCLPGNLALKTDAGGVTNRAMPSQSPLINGAVTVNGGNAVMAGQSFTVSWPAATDVDTLANGVTYTVMRSFDGGTLWYHRATLPNALSFSDTIDPYATTTVKYMVYASDSYCRSINEIVSATVQVISNTAPIVPPTISVGALPLEKGGPVAISWGASTDQDNNLVGYKLERLVNSGTWELVYEGTALSFSETLGEWNTVSYRVCAIDGYGAASGYRTSSVYTLREPVHITVTVGIVSSFADGDTYTEDEDRDIVFAVANTVDPGMTRSYIQRLTLDGVQLAAASNTIPGGTYTYTMSKTRWQLIKNGEHTLLLTVSDGGENSGSASITFTKDISQVIIKSEPVEVQMDSGIIKNFMMNVVGRFPLGSMLSVQITNNAKDGVGTVWQDILPNQLDGTYYPINNSEVSNGNWFAVRVTLDRGAADELCWINQISGMAGLSQTFILGQENEQLRREIDELKTAPTRLDVVQEGVGPLAVGDTFHGRAIFVSGNGFADNEQKPTTRLVELQNGFGYVFWRQQPDQFSPTVFTATFSVTNYSQTPPTAISHTGLVCDTVENLGLAAHFGVTFSDPAGYVLKCANTSNGIDFLNNLLVFFSPQTVTGDGSPYDLTPWSYYSESGGGVMGESKIVEASPDLSAVGNADPAIPKLLKITGATQEIVQALFCDFPRATQLQQGLAVYDEDHGWLQEVLQ